MYLAGGTTVLLDEQTLPVVESSEELSLGIKNLILKSNNG